MLIVELWFWIYLISVLLHQNLSLGVLSNFIWSTSKPYLHIFYPIYFWKDMTGVSVGVFHLSSSIDWLQSRKSSHDFLVRCYIYYFVGFSWFCQFQSFYLVVTVRVVLRGTKEHWVCLSQSFGDQLEFFPPLVEVFNHLTSCHWCLKYFFP